MTQRRLEYVRLDELRQHPRNPEFKDHDAAGIAASVNRHGFVEPPIVDERTDYLLGGHGRLEHLETARGNGEEPPEGIDVADDGMWLVPTILGWSSRSDAEALALMVALNRLPEAGGWKPRGLADLLDEISREPLGLDGTGYSQDDLDAQLAALAEPEFPPGSGDDQPRLDQRTPVVCPECGHSFQPK